MLLSYGARTNEDILARETLGQILNHAGRRREALAVYEALARDVPKRPSVWVGIANIRAGLEQFDQSLEVLDQLLATHPDHIQALLTKGQILNRIGRRNDAVHVFRSVLSLSPDDTDAMRSLLEVTDDEQDGEERRALLGRLVQIEPALTDAWIRHGELAWNADTKAATTTVQDGSFENAARLADRLQSEKEHLTEEIQGLEVSIHAVERETAAWGRQIAAHRHMLGFADTIQNWAIYEQTKIHLRNSSLFARKYGTHASYPKAPERIPAELLSAFTMGGAWF
ncbi:MAG: tetratricopeptide repeat protein [Betaproteobacteria bacterium]